MKKNMLPLKSRIQVAILTVFIVLLMMTSGTIITYNYKMSSAAFLNVAEQQMATVDARVMEQTVHHLSPAMGVISVAAAQVKETDVSLHNNDVLVKLMLEALKVHPQLDAFYNGDARGNLLQISRIGQEATFALQKDKPLPKDAKFLVRKIDRTEETPKERREYRTIEGEVVAIENIPAAEIKYDPRQRPWYKGVDTIRKPYWTDVYLYENNDVGITAAYPVKDEHGKLKAVLSSDVTLLELSQMMKQQKVGKSGIVFIADSKGHLIAYPDSHKTFRRGEAGVTLAYVHQAGEESVTQAFAIHQQILNGSHEFKVKEVGYIATFKPLGAFMNKDWLIGVVVPTDDFVGHIKDMNRTTLYLSMVIMLVASGIILIFSRRISTPIRLLAEDMRKIQNFELEDSRRVKSFLYEILYMDEALRAMKNGLRAFSRFVPRDVVHQLIQSGKGAELGGDKRELTVLFTDIENFSTIAESLPTEELMPHISEYLDELARIINAHKGTIDKYIGDAIMAFWGAPLLNDNHAYDACRAVLACSRKVDELNKRWHDQGKPLLLTRFGLNMGETIVGNLGSYDRMNYTAIGDTVNLASRLEGINKVYGTYIVASHSVYERLKDCFLFRPLDVVRVKGKTQGVKIYQLVAGNSEDPEYAPTHEQIEWCQKTEEALDAYLGRQWEKAISLYQEVARKHPSDKVPHILIERCKGYQKNPPEKGWLGIMKMMEK